MPGDLQPYSDPILDVIETIYTDKQLPAIDDDRKGKINPLMPISIRKSSRAVATN